MRSFKESVGCFIDGIYTVFDEGSVANPEVLGKKTYNSFLKAGYLSQGKADSSSIVDFTYTTAEDLMSASLLDLENNVPTLTKEQVEDCISYEEKNNNRKGAMLILQKAKEGLLA